MTTALVGSSLAAVLLSGVAVAAKAPAVPEQELLTAAEAAVAPSPLDEPALDDAPLEAPLDVPPPPAPAAPPGVAPLQGLRVPDLLVRLTAPLTLEQAGALSAVEAVEAVTVVDTGTITVGGEPATVLGVDPSEFRAFTPQETAASDALWAAVARGDLAPSYGLAEARDLELGTDVVVTGAADVPGRIGAVAAYGLPDVDLVTDRATAQRLGASPSGTVVLSAPGSSTAALSKAVKAVLGPDAEVEVLRPEPVAAPRAGRPTSYRELYIDSARYCPGLSWTVLAAIGQVESGHGKHLGPSSAGALGPMQFLPSTWAAYGVDGDGDGKADIMNPMDAVPSSAGYLCRFGAARGPDGLYDAIFAYNHADWYVQKVLGIAAQYR